MALLVSADVCRQRVRYFYLQKVNKKHFLSKSVKYLKLRLEPAKHSLAEMPLHDMSPPHGPSNTSQQIGPLAPWLTELMTSCIPSTEYSNRQLSVTLATWCPLYFWDYLLNSGHILHATQSCSFTTWDI